MDAGAMNAAVFLKIRSFIPLCHQGLLAKIDQFLFPGEGKMAEFSQHCGSL